MTELERRALLGDAKAQKECTEKEMVLPCPFCGCGEAETKWHHGYWSIQCGYAHDALPSKHCFMDWGEFNSAEEAIEAWNTRPALLTGRCAECKNSPNIKTRTKNMRWCRKFRNEIKPQDYCSCFEPKEEST